LGAQGIRLLRMPVGDKYVLEEMLRTGAVLGGEQSATSSSRNTRPRATASSPPCGVLEIMQESGRGLDELTGDLEIYPQRLVNVRIKERKPLEEMPAVVAEIRAAERAWRLGVAVLVRFSVPSRWPGDDRGPDVGQVADLTAASPPPSSANWAPDATCFRFWGARHRWGVRISSCAGLRPGLSRRPEERRLKSGRQDEIPTPLPLWVAHPGFWALRPAGTGINEFTGLFPATNNPGQGLA